MDQPANYLPYESTGYFSKLVSDYLQQSPALQPFFRHTPDMTGIQHAIEARRSFDTPRGLLVEVLNEQYAGIDLSPKLKANIASLADGQTFTVTTAHQPNIFTGPLYFIYKIIHTIKLADQLSAQMPAQKIVPVYYMGSEDADLDELGHVTVGGQKLTWKTSQAGAVGRMKVDKALTSLVHEINGQAGVLPFGKELNDLFQRCYTEGRTIQQATLLLVNELFGAYGLVVLVPDNAKLKMAFTPVVEKELLEGFSHKCVAETIEQLGRHYKVQAGGREINLFYLLDDKRERIERRDAGYEVRALGLHFTKEEILQELGAHPERFSANVILRGVFQETILPNIAFIGGGGELAYWLELKKVFDAVKVPYPVLLLRNSFLLVKMTQADKWQKSGFTNADLFADTQSLLNALVKRESAHQLTLEKELQQVHAQYAQLKQVTDKVDKTLSQHVEALEKKAVKKLAELEKKILRAERGKYEAQQKRLAQLKSELFPGNNLQERVDNFSLYYALYGKSWLKQLYAASTAFNEGFGIVSVN
ncbi:MAG: bshC [Sediminibacterium sp.]|nr:bshC [Sediminibacterium sp.]